MTRQIWQGLADDKISIFIDLFHSFSCLWEVTSKEYHHRDIRHAAMQSIAAFLAQEGEVGMTGECFKTRSEELSIVVCSLYAVILILL